MKYAHPLRLAFACCLLSVGTQAGEGPTAIPAQQLGAAAQAGYEGDGIRIRQAGEGAELRVIFQKLAGQATAEGLWLESTERPEKPERFRVRASAVGRDGAVDFNPLLGKGVVRVAADHAAYLRPGLVEEYRVSMDGVRQDFVVMEKPAGAGALNVMLEVSGAKATSAGYGARLTLDGSGRGIAYSRLHVMDARGRVLKARMEAATPQLLRLVVDDRDAAYPVRIDPTFSDEDWISLGGISSVAGEVYSMVLHDGSLYVGGIFLEVGELEASCIARWDGTSWSALGQGVNGLVHAMVVHDSTLYIGGEFSEAGGNTARNLAAWDIGTSTWSEVGGGVNSAVFALHYEGGLIVGGQFSEAGGNTAHNIAKWDGTSWSTYHDDPIELGIVYSMAMFGGDLVAGGEFGGDFNVGVSRWDGTAWQPLGGGVGGSIPYVRAMTVSTDGLSLYAGGDFVTAGGNSAARIARWDGTAWSALGSGLGSRVRALAWQGANLLAAGNFSTAGSQHASKLAQWDGSSWTPVMPAESLNHEVYALAVSGSDIFLGGNFTQATSIYSQGLVRWDGSALSRMAGTGLNNEVFAVLVAGSDIYFGGLFTNAGSMIANKVVKWDGSTWSPLGAGIGSGQVSALARIGSDIYAAGTFSTAGGVSANRVAKWDGSAWSALGSGALGPVNALAVMGTDLFVGGAFSSAGGVTGTGRVARWDGTAWHALNSGLNGTSGVNAMLVKGTDLYVAGLIIDNDAAAPANLRGVARWDGTAWHALAGGVGTAYALASDGDDLLVGGGFTQANNNTVVVNNIARWNGSAWSALGTGVNGRVQAIAVHSTGIYAGGVFTQAGGSPANRIARWDGSSWSALGSGIPGGGVAEVNALAVTGDNLFVGGFFGVAGGKVSNCAAMAQLPALDVVSQISFTHFIYETAQGANEVIITLERTNAAQAASVRFSTANGTNNANPPFTAGRAGTDFVAQNSTLVEFDAGVASKTVTVSLIPRTGSVPNTRFRMILNNPSENAVIGEGAAQVYILADDSTPPTVNITFPTEGFAFSNLPPISVNGAAGDARGIREVTLSFNGGPPVQAILGSSSNPLNRPFSGSFTPLEGANTVVATAYDMRGNSAQVTRNFVFTRSYVLTVSRSVPPAASSNPDLAGTILLNASPTVGATRLSPASRTSPQTSNVTPGTEVKLTARPKTGFFFSHWSGLPAGSQLAGTGVTFIMPAEDVPNVTATFVISPFTDLPSGSRIKFYGQVRPEAGSPVNNSTVGFLTATLTTSTGALSGKLLINGLSQSFSAKVFGNGSIWFNVSGASLDTLSFGARRLTLQLSNNEIEIVVNDESHMTTSVGAAKPAIYSAANPVPSSLINNPGGVPQPNGYFTIAFPSKAQTPPRDSTTFPQGTGYSTLDLGANGNLTTAGLLADGSKFTASSALVEGDVAPVFCQLVTPGTTNVKGGSFGGDLTFDAAQPDTDVSAQDMLWLRAVATVPLYAAGWPSGLQVDSIGALYDRVAGAQAALGMGPVDPATRNGRITFTEGKLTAPIIKTNFNVNGNLVAKVPPVPVDRSFTLLISSPYAGVFRGTLVPPVGSPAGIKLNHQGIILSKGANRGGYGYFLGNAVGDSTRESGLVLLE